MSKDSDRALLEELSCLDSVEALTVTDEDHLQGNVRETTELVLNLERDGRTLMIELTRHDGELIIQVLHEVLHPGTHEQGPVSKLWFLLDEQMDFLLADDDPEPEDKVRAKALAEAITLLTQPTTDPEHIDVSEVREEAVRRWENRE